MIEKVGRFLRRQKKPVTYKQRFGKVIAGAGQFARKKPALTAAIVLGGLGIAALSVWGLYRLTTGKKVVEGDKNDDIQKPMQPTYANYIKQVNAYRAVLDPALPQHDVKAKVPPALDEVLQSVDIKTENSSQSIHKKFCQAITDPVKRHIVEQFFKYMPKQYQEIVTAKKEGKSLTDEQQTIDTTLTAMQELYEKAKKEVGRRNGMLMKPDKQQLWAVLNAAGCWPVEQNNKVLHDYLSMPQNAMRYWLQDKEDNENRDILLILAIDNLFEDNKNIGQILTSIVNGRDIQKNITRVKSHLIDFIDKFPKPDAKNNRKARDKEAKKLIKAIRCFLAFDMSDDNGMHQRFLNSVSKAMKGDKRLQNMVREKLLKGLEKWPEKTGHTDISAQLRAIIEVLTVEDNEKAKATCNFINKKNKYIEQSHRMMHAVCWATSEQQWQDIQDIMSGKSVVSGQEDEKPQDNNIPNDSIRRLYRAFNHYRQENPTMQAKNSIPFAHFAGFCKGYSKRVDDEDLKKQWTSVLSDWKWNNGIDRQDIIFSRSKPAREHIIKHENAFYLLHIDKAQEAEYNRRFDEAGGENSPCDVMTILRGDSNLYHDAERQAATDQKQKPEGVALKLPSMKKSFAHLYHLSSIQPSKEKTGMENCIALITAMERYASWYGHNQSQ